MKKVISLIVCICILSVSFTISAAPFIELNDLEYEEYMRGETIFVSGDTNVYVNLGIYYPESEGGTLKFFMTYSPEELRDGIEFETDTDIEQWPDGVWSIVVQNGDVAESLEFTLCETVDRTEEETQKPTTSKPGSNTESSVVSITPAKTEVTLKAGKSEKIEITTTASSLSVEVEDEDVVSASLSGKTLTINALKRGESAIWLRSSGNYATVNVTVTPKSTGGPSSSNREEVTEKETEVPTEIPTEEVTELPTEVPTEEVTEPTTEAPTELDTAIENPFADLSDTHWAKDSILTLYSKGIINGMNATTFAPEDSVTRAQFVTMLTKAFGLEAKVPLSPFDDVKRSDWYFDYVMAAYENGIANGYGGKFNPNSLVSRQDMATFAHRAATNSGISFGRTTYTMFSDHELISDYAVEAVYSMRAEGVINGMTSKTFEPRGYATRAQAAHIIAKLLELD